MKRLERAHGAVRKELRAYVTSINDDFEKLQKQTEHEHGELVRVKSRLLSVEHRLDRARKKG